MMQSDVILVISTGLTIMNNMVLKILCASLFLGIAAESNLCSVFDDHQQVFTITVVRPIPGNDCFFETVIDNAILRR